MKAARALGLIATAYVALGPLALPLAGQSEQGSGIAIVVHPDTPVDDLSADELRSIFLAERQFWGDRSRITLLVRAPVSYERSIVLDRIYQMNEEQFRQYWIAKMFRAEVATGPKIVYSAEMAMELVTVIKGAITFVPAGEVQPGMKVLRIDGKMPSEAGYLLR